MSLFFEDVEITPVKTESAPTPVVVEDVTGFLAVTLESEMAWHNLATSIMREEFKAVINEDEKQAEGAKKDMFQKAAQFFANIWKQFVAAVQNLVARLQAKFTDGGKFLASRADRLNKYTGGAQATIYDWKVASMNALVGNFPASLGQALIKSIASANNTGKEVTADEMAKGFGYESFSGIDSGIVSKAHSGERKATAVTTAMVNNAAGDIRSAKGVLGHVKKLSNEAKSIVSQGQAAAKAGLQYVQKGDTESQKKAAAAIATAKTAQSLISKILNVFVKVSLDRYADSMRIISAAVGSAKATEKDNKAAGKQAKKNEKGKSSGTELATVENMEDDIFDLTLEDFEDEGEDEKKDEEVELEDLDLDIELEELDLELED